MNLNCLTPFTTLEFHPRGEVYTCCPAWRLNGAVGNIYHQSIEEIWNGDQIVKLRKQVYEGQYHEAGCQTHYCPFMKNPLGVPAKFPGKSSVTNKKLARIIEQVKQKKLRLTTGPMEISLAHSGECNLRCRMCISHDGFNPIEHKLNRLIFDTIIPSLLPDLALIKLSGNGDPFFQAGSRKLLQTFDPQKYPEVKFEILTNGLLLNERMWESVKHNRFESVNVSVDAASKETYEKTRINGKWEVLQKNLKLLSRLRYQKKIGRFYINMTVMKTNHHEIRDFAQMGLDLGCDQVSFNRIFGLKDLQDIEDNINIFPNPDVLLNLKTALQDPIFDHPKVDSLGLQEYRAFSLRKTAYIGYKVKLLAYRPLIRLLYKTSLHRPLQKIKHALKSLVTLRSASVYSDFS